MFACQTLPHRSMKRVAAALDGALQAGLFGPMNKSPDDPAEAKRKLMGRAMVVGFLVLVAVYAVFTFLGRR